PPALDGAAFPEPLELLDLDYREDRDADVDLNLVMTGAGQLVEVQAGGEGATFRLEPLGRLRELGKRGMDPVPGGQRGALGPAWPGAGQVGRGDALSCVRRVPGAPPGLAGPARAVGLAGLATLGHGFGQTPQPGFSGRPLTAPQGFVPAEQSGLGQPAPGARA